MKELKGITEQGLKELIAHYEQMGHTYFWTPAGNASSRRYEEKKNSRDVEFTADGKEYNVKIVVSCSCKNYYATRTVTVDGEEKKQGLRTLKSLLK